MNRMKENIQLHLYELTKVWKSPAQLSETDKTIVHAQLPNKQRLVEVIFLLSYKLR